MKYLPLLFALACGAKVGPASIQHANQLVVTVDVDADQSGPVWVTTTVANTGTTDATFCTYHTPFEGIRNDIFVVTQGRKELDYRGIMAKRAPPGPEDYRTLGPGESDQARVDLRDGYDVKTGSYTVRYRGTSISGLDDSKAAAFTVP